MAEGRQDGAFASSKATAPLVSFDLDCDEHYAMARATATTIGFPMDAVTAADFDLDYAAEETVRHRSNLRSFRKSRINPN